MRISFLPAGTRQIASSRLRVHALLEPLTRLGVTAELGVPLGSDAVFIQKRVTPKILELARAAKREGAAVIYDCDDLGAALELWAPRHLVQDMVHLADVVTTNTESYRQALSSEFGAMRVELLRDTIDYGLTNPLASIAPLEGPLRILWFGNCTNISMISRYFSPLSRRAGSKLVVCTHLCSRTDAVATTAPPCVEFVPWSLEEFPALLRSCHLSLLPHDGGLADRAKSNNRMVASIAWGVPAIVSRTPEYERTAELAGVQSAVFEREDEMMAAVEAHQTPSARRRYLLQAQPILWSRHCVDVIARRLIEIVAGARRQ